MNDKTPTTTAGRTHIAASLIMNGDAILATNGETVAYAAEPAHREADGTITVKAHLPGHGDLTIAYGTDEKVWILNEGHAAQPTDDLGEFDENHAPKIQD